MAQYSRRDFIKGGLLASTAVGAGLSFPNVLRAQDTVKIGVLHSLSGTMAISEVSLRDTVLMAVEEINAKGGVMGKKIAPVVVDPASNWDLFAEKAKQLLLQDKVAVVFGCWTSVSRKSVLPVFENNNGLLFYPVQYEGEECSKNVFYTGATPNQQLIPGAEYLMSKEGGGFKKFYLLGTDYVFPRTANKILRAFLVAKGVPADNIAEEYTPFNHQDYQTIVGKIKRFSQGGSACVLSTINGDSNVPFYSTLLVVDALIRANKDFDLIIFPNRGHGFGNEPYMVRRRWDYFVRWLLDKEPPANYEIRTGTGRAGGPAQ